MKVDGNLGGVPIFLSPASVAVYGSQESELEKQGGWQRLYHLDEIELHKRSGGE